MRQVRRVPAARVAPGTIYRRLPDGETELLLGAGMATAVGTRLAPLFKVASGGSHVVIVRFRVGGLYPFVDRPVAEMTDEVVPLEELWDRRVVEAVARRPLEALQALPRRDHPSARATRRALARLHAMARLPTVRELAADVGASERQLRRAFVEVVGLPPKAYLRVLRFRRVVAEAQRAGTLSWADLALRAGYADQAHLIADFRALSGTTPAAFRRS